MDLGIKKIAKIVKRKNKWCVISHRKGKDGKYRNFGCYESKEDAKKRLGQIFMFKHKKAELIDTIIEVSDEINKKGMFHISDVLAGCIEAIALENTQGNTVIKLGKIISLLHKKGELDVAERLDLMLPEILCFENCDCDADFPKHKNRITADKVYKIAEDLKKKYQTGIIDESSFEFSKMKELESMLKIGFLLPPPEEYKELPTDSKNWFEHFTNKGVK
jgi:hypothetical protein